MERLALETRNITDENIKKILELFPNVATEAEDENGNLKRAIDFEKLKQELSEVAIDGEESYDFTWVGKKEAMVEANRPIKKTLRPDRTSSVDWENTQNIYIEGDNLEALKLLQESYLGKVKMIYIDPPYNTGNDFVYKDNFTQDKESYEEELGINDEEGNKLFKNTESNGRFHSDWCSMIYSRLKLARNLLSDDGVIFISIDDNEIDNLRKICDEIFGSINYIANIIWQSRTSISNDQEISLNHNHTVIYAKNNLLLKFYGEPLDESEYCNPDNDVRGPWKLTPLDANKPGGDTYYSVLNPYNHKEYFPPKGRSWAINRNDMQKLIDDGRVKFGINDDSAPKRKLFLYERMEKGDTKTPSSIMLNAGTTKDGTNEVTTLFDNKKVFSYPKPVSFICKLLTYGLHPNKENIVIDFFSGSATTAHSVMQYNLAQQNTKYILIQLPENLKEIKDIEKDDAKKTIENAIDFLNSIDKPALLTEIGKERIRRAGKKIQEENPDKKIDVGFRVFKVDDTNMNDVYYAPSELQQTQLGLLESNIKSDRTDEDLLYGCLLDWGVELSLPHKVEIIDGKRVHIVDEDALVACFEEDIPESVIRKIADMKPLRVVFRDSSFISDDNKINIEEIFKLITPDTRVKVI